MQAVLALVLVVITGCYAWLTKQLLTRAEASARAAERSAAASETTIAFLKQQYEERLGLGRQIVREEIARAKALIESWRREAKAQSWSDPDAIGRLTLVREAGPHARQISTKLADLLVEIETVLYEVHAEMNILRDGAGTAHTMKVKDAAARAIEHLDTATRLLQDAERLLPL